MTEGFIIKVRARVKGLQQRLCLHYNRSRFFGAHMKGWVKYEHKSIM